MTGAAFGRMPGNPESLKTPGLSVVGNCSGTLFLPSLFLLLRLRLRQSAQDVDVELDEETILLRERC